MLLMMMIMMLPMVMMMDDDAADEHDLAIIPKITALMLMTVILDIAEGQLCWS